VPPGSIRPEPERRRALGGLGPRAARLVTGAGLLLTAVLFGTWAVFIALHGVDVPRMDQLDTPAGQIRALEAGQLDWSMLARQHNESRKVVPNLVSLLVYTVRGHYDLRAEMFAGWAICAMLVSAIAWLAWLTTRSGSSTALLVAFFSSLLWSRHTLALHLFSVTFERLLPELFLVAGIGVLLASAASWPAVSAAALACTAAQFSYAGGVVAWPLVLVFLAWSERLAGRPVVAKLSAVAVVAALSSLLYFQGYRAPPKHSRMIDVLSESPVEMLDFVLLFLGNAVTSSQPAYGLALGAAVLAAFCVLAVPAVRTEAEPHVARARLAWVVVGLYSLAQALLAMAGRLPMGLGNALRSDYVSHAMYLYVAVAALGLLAGGERTRRGTAIACGIGAIALSATLVAPGMREDLQQHASHFRYTRACLLLARLHELPCLDLVFPDVERRSAAIEGISPFLVRPLLDRLPDAPAGEGTLLSWAPRGGAVVLTGTARVEGDPARAVVVTRRDGARERIVRIVPVGQKRAYAPRNASGDALASGFGLLLRAEDLRPGPCGLRFRGVDAEGVPRPLSGLVAPGCALPAYGTPTAGDDG